MFRWVVDKLVTKRRTSRKDGRFMSHFKVSMSAQKLRVMPLNVQHDPGRAQSKFFLSTADLLESNSRLNVRVDKSVLPHKSAQFPKADAGIGCGRIGRVQIARSTVSARCGCPEELPIKPNRQQAQQHVLWTTIDTVMDYFPRKVLACPGRLAVNLSVRLSLRIISF